MTPETLKVYGPCPTHRIYHDLEQSVEKAEIAPSPEMDPGKAEISRDVR